MSEPRTFGAVRVIAHRGASAEEPENTIAAFDRAVEIGADMIELDVRVSRDDVLYVAHDPPAKRALRGRDTPLLWPAIRAAAVPGAYPALAEVLERYPGRIELNLEVKERRAAPLLLAELRRRSLDDGILLSSFDRQVMRIFHEEAPDLARGLLAVRPPVRLAAELARYGARAYHPRHTAVRARHVRLVHALGLPVYVWTVDDPVEIRRLGLLGVDGFFTNDPRGALEALGRGARVGDALRVSEKTDRPARAKDV